MELGKMSKKLATGFLATAFSFLAIAPAQAIDVKADCLDPIANDIDFDDCVISLDEEVLAVKYDNEKQAQFNRTISIEKIKSISSRRFFSNGAFNTSLRVLTTIYYRDDDDRPQVDTYVFRPLKARVFRSHLELIRQAKSEGDTPVTNQSL